MGRKLGHENLKVYGRALDFVRRWHGVAEGVESAAAALDHLDRASESVVAELANGNSRRTQSDRNHHFDIAFGSGLECAACLNICVRKQILSSALQRKGKRHLHSIVCMIFGLMRARSPMVTEESIAYVVDPEMRESAVFSHERLTVYQQALALVQWLDGLFRNSDIPARHATSLDRMSTGVVLNIA